MKAGSMLFPHKSVLATLMVFIIRTSLMSAELNVSGSGTDSTSIDDASLHR